MSGPVVVPMQIFYRMLWMCRSFFWCGCGFYCVPWLSFVIYVNEIVICGTDYCLLVGDKRGVAVGVMMGNFSTLGSLVPCGDLVPITIFVCV
jgi:hypothetical protein